MAISKLAIPQWRLISSSSPTSGSSVSFSSLPACQAFKLVYFNIDTSSTNVRFECRLNNDSTSNYAYVSLIDGAVLSDGINDSIILGEGSGVNANDHSGLVTINFANQPIKEINYWHASGTSTRDSNNGCAYWNDDSLVNQVDLILTSATFTSGTVKIYGLS
jgi:hypothetical protein